jgi:molybdopterin molybdotransferase
MAKIRFEVPSVLRRFSGGAASTEVEAEHVAGALESVLRRWPDLRSRVFDVRGSVFPYLILFKNGDELARDALADVALSDGDVVEMVGAAEGGSVEAGGGDDVRMRGFRKRVSLDEARAVALDGLCPLPAEGVAVTDCAGRVLASDVTSDVDVPPFRRAAMDGYAVRAEDTFGATHYAPVVLRLTGESMPGGAAAAALGPGESCRIMTGAAVPDGADAVLPAEQASEKDGSVEAVDAIPPGKHVARIGEDVDRGTVLLRAGRRLRPQDVGILASVGCSPVPVVRRPRVRLLVTGNELLLPGERPAGNRIVDSNSPMLAALVERDGGGTLEIVRLEDDEAVIRDALSRDGADVVLTSGGTSVGKEDFIPVLVRELGDLTVHGIAVRPASPTGIGRIGAARMFLLPGNPVSCLSAYDFLAGPAIRRMAGLPAEWPYGAAALPLAGKIASQLGRTDYVRVALSADGVVPIAAKGASILSSATRADGFVIVPPTSEGLPEGASVEVHFYDAWTLDAR